MVVFIAGDNSVMRKLTFIKCSAKNVTSTPNHRKRKTTVYRSKDAQGAHEMHVVGSTPWFEEIVAYVAQIFSTGLD